MVDCIALPFFIEALYILIFQTEKNGARISIWFAFLCGCFFANKMTNVVFVGPILLLYLIRNKKNIGIKTFLASFLIAIVPVSVYLIYAFKETGNPIFPYFNNIFRSPYFSIHDFKDMRWGPTGIVETIFWPVLSAINPEYRTSEIPNISPLVSSLIMIGWALEFVYVIVGKEERTKEKQALTLLGVLFITSSILWSISTGHVRYFILGYIIAGLLLVGFLTSAFNYLPVGLRLSSLLIVILMLAQSINTMVTVAKGREWSWRDSTYLPAFKENAQLAFRDQDTSIKGKDVDTIVLNYCDSGSIANMLFPKARIFNRNYLHRFEMDPDLIIHKSHEMDNALKTGKAYDLMSSGSGDTWREYLRHLNENQIGRAPV